VIAGIGNVVWGKHGIGEIWYRGNMGSLTSEDVLFQKEERKRRNVV